MSRLSPHHETLIHGEGKCSVPMWQMGTDAGFCDAPAFGVRPPCAEYPGPWWAPGDRQRHDGKYNGYVPGLACEIHGGPSLASFAVPGGLVTKDGNMWCSTAPDFINLAESEAGFGATPAEATADLLSRLAAKEQT